MPAPDLPSEPNATPAVRGHSPPYGLFCATIVIVVALGAGLIAYFKIVDTVARSVSGIAEAFHTETITETFYSDRLKIISSGSATLELAVAERTERFTRSSSVTLWDQLLPLGTTESEVTVPATYRYHINLDDEWSLSTRNQTCIVIAPAYRPSLPVAIDTGEMQKKTRSGWARFDKIENLEALERTITRHLEERACSPENLGAVREECRESVGRFVEQWLLGREHWAEDRFNEIIVFFSDEAGPETAPALRPVPSLKLNPAGAPPGADRPIRANTGPGILP